MHNKWRREPVETDEMRERETSERDHEIVITQEEKCKDNKTGSQVKGNFQEKAVPPLCL